MGVGGVSFVRDKMTEVGVGWGVGGVSFVRDKMTEVGVGWGLEELALSEIK